MRTEPKILDKNPHIADGEASELLAANGIEIHFGDSRGATEIAIAFGLAARSATEFVTLLDSNTGEHAV